MLYVPSFPFQLLLDNKLTYTFNCDVIFTHHKVIFQDPLTKKMIGEGFFFLHSLYYFSNDSQVSRGFQASFKSSYKPFLWHCPLAHPSDFVFSKINRNLLNMRFVIFLNHLNFLLIHSYHMILMHLDLYTHMYGDHSILHYLILCNFY